jgi:hypothetical protein
MSRSKICKRGQSHHIESWNAEAKRFIVQCTCCQRRGFLPSILEPGFADTLRRRVVRSCLQDAMGPLDLNDAGLCAECAEVFEEREDAEQGNAG